MKSTGVIALALLLILGPVAWTVEACLDGHPNHAFEEVSARDDQHDDDAGVPNLHCVAWEQHFGAALRSAPVVITRSVLVSLIDVVSQHATVSTSTDTHLWLEAVFKKLRISLFSHSLSRHLLLSVIRI